MLTRFCIVTKTFYLHFALINLDKHDQNLTKASINNEKLFNMHPQFSVNPHAIKN